MQVVFGKGAKVGFVSRVIFGRIVGLPFGAQTQRAEVATKRAVAADVIFIAVIMFSMSPLAVNVVVK